MKMFSTYEIWYGRNVPPPEQVKLQSGPLELLFQEGDLRYIRHCSAQLGKPELIRRVYVAIRDHNWNTIPGKISNLSIQASADRFEITFHSHHRTKYLDFEWQASIHGNANGQISYSMDGIANSDFRYCRIGFCILHPIRECAGRPFKALTPNGEISGNLPVLIEPQRFEGRYEAPIFPSFSSLTVQLDRGVAIHTDLEGDLFETEDQRNWTDGSFKTYCTPLALGYPHTAKAGQKFHQKVTIWFEEKGPVQEARTLLPQESVELSVGESLQARLPKIGFGLTLPGSPSPREVNLLSQLHPDHLKVELHFRDPAWSSLLDQAAQTARLLHTALELAIFLIDNPEDHLERLKNQLIGLPIARLIIFHESEASRRTTSRRWLEIARKYLRDVLPDTPIVGGTNGNFAELNRDRPETSAFDGVSYPINPQVHASDEASLIEALEAQEHTVLTARTFCDSLPIIISAVTLKPPFNPVATEQEAPPDPGELPSSVDPRQMSLFCAAWTLGSIRSLTMGGAASVTYYETLGWRGLIETAQGSPLPDKFRSQPGMIFPLYHLFADLAEAKSADFIPLLTNSPLVVTGIMLMLPDHLTLLAANLSPVAQQVKISSLPSGMATLRRLNEQTASLACFEPDQFRARKEPLEVTGSQLVLPLLPYETIRLDMKK